MTSTYTDGTDAAPILAAGLAEFAHRLTWDTLGDAAADHTALLILDAMGCALAGWAAEETPQVLQLARSLGAGGQSAIVGAAEPASMIGSVLANAYLTTAITSCDVYVPAHCHLTPEVVPAALAAAEQQHAGGRALLTAVAAGLEVASRLLRAIDYAQFRRRGWHAPGVIGPVGAAVAAGLLLGLDADRLRTAMSLAVSQAAGTFAAWPTTTVKFHQARGAMAGLLSACLAAEGFMAGPDPFQAPDGGLFSSYSPGDAEQAQAGLGAVWELAQISVRLWPGATPVQALLTALLGSGRRLPPAAELTAVTIRVPPATYQAHRDLTHPVGCFDALLSFHYVAATALVYGRFDIELTGPAYCTDSDIAAFIDERVALTADPAVPLGGVHVTLTTLDGGTVDIRQEHALGTPQNAATGEQIEDKFRRNASARLGPERGAALLAMLGRLEQVADCADLLRLTQWRG